MLKRALEREYIMKSEYDFKEIFKLRDMINTYNTEHIPDDKIHYTFKDDGFVIQGEKHTGYHIWCYDGAEDADTWYISIIQNFGSFGREEDKLEIRGLLTEEESEHDSVVGWLSAENVFERILKHLKDKKGNDYESKRYV